MPLFPPNATEEQLEIRLERMVDSLDSRFMKSAMTQAEYDSEIRELYKQIENAIDRLPRKA